MELTSALYINLAIILAVLVVAYVAGLLWFAVRLQEQMWVAVQPPLLPTLPENLLPAEREVLGHIARMAGTISFVPAANVHSADLASGYMWTQALFPNRGAGDRPSGIILRGNR